MEEFRTIEVDDNSELFDTTGMFYKEFPSDERQIRYFTLLILQKAPPEIREVNLLDQQIGELIRNAVKHGNKGDKNKKVSVWYAFTSTNARVIVQDEGEGFQNLETWKEFHRKRSEAFYNQDFDELEKYLSYRTEKSDDMDGGNALFAAVEYWNDGVVFNKKKNRIAVSKTFPRTHHGISITSMAEHAGS